jgi:hypothetical protein
MKASLAFAILAMLVGFASAIEWWRASTVKPVEPMPSAPPPISPAPAVNRPPGIPAGGISMGGMYTQAQRSGEINSRAAFYSGIGVMLSGAASIASAFGY